MRVTTTSFPIQLLIATLIRQCDVLAYVNSNSAFVDRYHYTHQHSSRKHGLLVLHVKKIPGTSHNKNEATSKSIGFGGVRSSSSSGSGTPITLTKSNELQGKLRSISSKSRIGAGSKQLRQAAITFDRIRKEHGKESSNDVYVRSPLNSVTTFWFVGKVAYDRTQIATIPDDGNADALVDGGILACISQKRLILEYSMHHLRPQNLGGTYASTLEIWIAPADSEMDVAQNKVTLCPVVGSARSTLPDHFKVDSVGYNPEIYIGDEIAQGGLRVQRDENGKPIKPAFEVNQTA